MTEKEQRTISRQFNLSFLLGAAVQTVTLVWFIAGLDNSVQSNAKEISRQDGRISSLEQVVQTQAVTLARMDENISAIRDLMESRK